MLSALSILTLTFLMFFEIISRSLFNYSTLIADEYSGYLNVAIPLFGLAYTFKTEGFIKIKILYDKFSNNTKKMLDIISMVMGLFYSIILLYYISIMVLQSYRTGVKSLFISKTPLYIPQSIIVIGLIFLIMQIIISLITKVVEREQ